MKIPKTTLPPVRIEKWRLANYRAALAVLNRSGYNLSFSEFLRQAIDNSTEAVFERFGAPTHEELAIQPFRRGEHAKKKAPASGGGSEGQG